MSLRIWNRILRTSWKCWIGFVHSDLMNYGWGARQCAARTRLCRLIYAFQPAACGLFWNVSYFFMSFTPAGILLQLWATVLSSWTSSYDVPYLAPIITGNAPSRWPLIVCHISGFYTYIALQDIFVDHAHVGLVAPHSTCPQRMWCWKIWKKLCTTVTIDQYFWTF